MNLLGWDTVSALGTPLANQALQAAQERLASRFSHCRDGLQAEGSFGPWQIVAGGAPGLLHMDLHIRDGTARGLGRGATDLAGMVLRIEVPLALVPSPDGKRPAELRFKTVEGTPPPDLIKPLALKDPRQQLDDIGGQMLQIALCECLSASMGSVSYVFAEIAPHNAGGGDWAATPYLDWACLNTGDGRQYLAIFGAMAPPRPDMALDKIDVEVIAGKGSAYFAFSPRIYGERLLLPWLNANFRPRAQFRANGGAITLARPVPLPPAPSKVGTLHPVIDRMTLSVAKGGLAIRLDAHAEAMGATVRVTMSMMLAMQLDKATGRVGLCPDPNPKTSYRVEGHGIFGWLVELIVHLIIGLTGTSITDIAKGIAAKMQALNAPGASMVHWNGVRDFVTTEAACDGCLWFADTRQG